jgi:hypothetical protein
MLTAAPGSASITRRLDQCYTVDRARRDNHDLAKHIEMFRISLVLAELALQAPFSYVELDRSSNAVKLLINDGEEFDVTELAEVRNEESVRIWETWCHFVRLCCRIETQ